MLALYSSPGLFSVVRGTVERLTEYLGFPVTEARSITRAVDEALTNIVRHSYGNRLRLQRAISQAMDTGVRALQYFP